ncbi:hypothetical protein VIGAN_01273200, partial [Vigna angularis var. angularis]
RVQCSYCKKIGHTQERCYSLHGFPDKTVQVFRSDIPESKISDEEYREFLRYKSEKSTNLDQSSTACISQTRESQNSWILDSGASDHLSGTWNGTSDWGRT